MTTPTHDKMRTLLDDLDEWNNISPATKEAALAYIAAAEKNEAKLVLLHEAMVGFELAIRMYESGDAAGATSALRAARVKLAEQGAALKGGT